MYRLALGTGLLAVLFAGAIFGFFYAWICSTMWGLDAADPRIAIAAMQAMNASVRNAVFAPAFFGTPFVLALAGVFSLMCAQRVAGASFIAAALTYALGGMMLTVMVNVPMNLELAGAAIPEDLNDAATLWRSYSEPWQMWNLTRTLFSGISLLLAAVGLVLLGRNPQRSA